MIEAGDEGIRLSGPLTIANAAEVLAAVSQEWPAEGFTGEFVIDLAGTGPLDSAAVSLMLSWQRKARVEGFAIRFTGIPAALDSLAELYDVGAMLGSANNTAAAP